MILSFCVVYGQDYWLPQNSPTTKDFVMCSFTDTSYGWVCGDSGLIVNTTNAGASWNLQNSGITNYKIESIYFLNRRLGWATCNDIYFTGTLILKTTNGGVNWGSSRFPDTTVVLNTVYYVDSLLGFITGETGQIFKTTNGGISWINCFIESSVCNGLFAKKDVHFLNSQTGYACGGALDFVGILWRTTNSGGNWSVHCLSPEPLNEVIPLGGGIVAAMGGDLEFGSNSIYSSNNGNNWSYGLTECFGAVTGFSFRTPREVWAVQSFSNQLAVNLDSMKPGSLWQCLPTPGNSSLYDIQFTSPTMGWAFGRGGVIYKYNTAIIGISQSSNNLPDAYVLYQNYPNPFNPVTNIKYDIPVSANVTIKIYDLLGREIYSVNEFKKAGRHEVEFDGADFASGMYFYSIESNGFKDTKKMVLVK